MSRLLDYYNNLTRILLTPLTPVVDALSEKIESIFSVKIVVDDAWRSVFVLMSLYFLRDSSLAFGQNRPALGTWRGVTGVMIALISAVAALASLSSLPENMRALAIPCWPLIGIFFYDFINHLFMSLTGYKKYAKLHNAENTTWVGYLAASIMRSVRRLLVGLLVVAAVFAIPFTRTLEPASSGLLMLTVLILSIAVYWIIRGYMFAISQPDDRKSHFVQAYVTRLGFSMIGVFFWLLVFLITNAGLQRFGL